VATLLCDPAAHEPLEPARWSDEGARTAIASIVERTLTAGGEDADLSLWTEDAGVAWALDALGADSGGVDLHDRYLEQLDGAAAPGLMQGETGVLLVSWRLEPTDAKADRLYEHVERLRRPLLRRGHAGAQSFRDRAAEEGRIGDDLSPAARLRFIRPPASAALRKRANGPKPG
jgi:hypothetical protein